MASTGVTLMMLKPDAVEQRLLGEALAWLTSLGCRPLQCREVWLREATRRALYQGGQGGWLDWDLNARHYLLGPVQVLAIEVPSGDFAADLSSRLKGDFRPAAARLCTLRHKLRAINPILNAVHMSDDLRAAEREREILDEELKGQPETRLGMARSIAAKHFATWDIVARCIGSVTGASPGADPRWPASYARADAAALLSVKHVLVELLVPGTAGHALVIGVLEGATSWDRWHAEFPTAEPWHTYLTYTTLRYLDLCLETRCAR